jgi:transcriptional regulator GlxA family with amidase domain
MTKHAQSLKEVVIVVYPGVQSLDFIGPQEVFAAAQKLIEGTGRTEPGYRITVASLDGAPLRTSSGLEIVPGISLADAPKQIDTLVIPGGAGSADASQDKTLLDWIETNVPRTRRIASVCTGAFVLAATGLLDGRRATTHWASAARLAESYPAVEVDPEPIYVRDGHVWTSAGVTAGMDLALALVEEDLDREAALTIARHLVLFLRRPGNQSQFSATLAAQEPEREPLREVQRYVVENVAESLSVEALAEQAHMSPRRDRNNTGPLRRARAPGGGSARAGGHLAADRNRRGGVRVRHGRDDAPRVPARAWGGSRRVPPSLPPGRLSD